MVAQEAIFDAAGPAPGEVQEALSLQAQAFQ